MTRSEVRDLASDAEERRSAGRAQKLPGEGGIWVFVLADMTSFSVFFVMFALYWRWHPGTASAGHTVLHTGLALINTVLLLVGSYFVVLAIAKIRIDPRRASALFWGAASTGVVFAVIKFVEYRALVGAGHTMTSNEYFTYYFAITGIHLLHVAVGITIMSVLAVCARRLDWTPERAVMYENGGSYWHMVDLLWLVILPLFYILN